MTMASIRQNPQADALPDFRNLGVIARILVSINVLAFGIVLAAEQDLARAADAFVRATALLQPVVVASLVALYVGARPLMRMRYGDGCLAVMAVVLAFAACVHAALGGFSGTTLWRTLAFAAAATALILAYLRLHQRAFSPALAEARLQALQARIRPHFLFNSLNAVLSLMRKDPKRAEHALEDLAELFRALVSDGRSLVRLADEIALLERYAAIEQLRLGSRLRMSWELDSAPMDALLPPLLLQPVLENAVYHGVEPGTGIGDVLVRIERRGNRVLALVENAQLENDDLAGREGNRGGSHMALDNIRERLNLFFDAEARLESRVERGRYRVEIEIPYRSGAK
jgi:two-component system, LytTR family, sensor histidine kinase AlgZ